MDDANLGEVAWVKTLLPWLKKSLASASTDDRIIDVCAGYELAYTNEVSEYDWDDEPKLCSNKYQTDLLISDCCPKQKWWIPLVVIECKLGRVNTHTVQNYSTKAATHKQVHPYLRYGFLMAGVGDHIPARVIRHGVNFDFIAAVKKGRLSITERRQLEDTLRREIRASRRLHGLFLNRKRDRDRYRILRRGLTLK